MRYHMLTRVPGGTQRLIRWLLLCLIRSLPNGNAELGVHIADVTHFLRPGTAMDAEAASRCARSA